MRHYLCRGGSVLGRREGDELPESGVEVLLVVVVGTGFDFLPPPFLLRPCPMIPAHSSNNQPAHALRPHQSVLTLIGGLIVVELLCTGVRRGV